MNIYLLICGGLIVAFLVAFLVAWAMVYVGALADFYNSYEER